MAQPLPPDAMVAVIGAGTMGSGIAHVAARAGHRVMLFDASPEAIDRGRQAIAKDLAFLVSRGRLSQPDADATLARVLAAARLSDTRDASLIVEAISEERGAKHELFSLLETMVRPGCILATNTSSISITELAQPLKHPGRLVGMHFFNPAPRMPLVEVIAGMATDPSAFDCVYDTARAWGKTPVRARSIPGFIVNRVARPYYGEALRLLSEQAADAATLDAVLRECGGFPMGPFELIDMIGLDVNLAVTRSVFEATAYDRRYAPSLIQQELVRAGRCGRKSGQGFHRYGEGVPLPQPATAPPGELVRSVHAVGNLGPAHALADRLQAKGMLVQRVPGDGPGYFEMGRARLAFDRRAQRHPPRRRRRRPRPGAVRPRGRLHAGEPDRARPCRPVQPRSLCRGGRHAASRGLRRLAPGRRARARRDARSMYAGQRGRGSGRARRGQRGRCRHRHAAWRELPERPARLGRRADTAVRGTGARPSPCALRRGALPCVARPATPPLQWTPLPCRTRRTLTHKPWPNRSAAACWPRMPLPGAWACESNRSGLAARA
jgi:3-hydroxyacyl-CoA dehydrogenase